MPTQFFAWRVSHACVPSSLCSLGVCRCPLRIKGAGTGASRSQNARRIPVKVQIPPKDLTGWRYSPSTSRSTSSVACRCTWCRRSRAKTWHRAHNHVVVRAVGLYALCGRAAHVNQELLRLDWRAKSKERDRNPTPICLNLLCVSPLNHASTPLKQKTC